MIIAKHPHKPDYISYGRYKIEILQKYVEDSKIPDHDKARCPICGAGLFTVDPESLNRDPHFRHPPKSDCPAVNKEHMSLKATETEKDKSDNRKVLFLQNFEQIYSAMRKDLVPCLSAEEFINILEHSIKKDFWRLKYLNLEMIPYCLVLLAYFPPWRGDLSSDRRRLWFRFAYEAKIKHIRDLWNHKPEAIRFFRISYKLPNGVKRPPEYRELCRLNELPVRTDLVKSAKVLPNNRREIKKIERWLKNSGDFNHLFPLEQFRVWPGSFPPKRTF